MANRFAYQDRNELRLGKDPDDDRNAMQALGQDIHTLVKDEPTIDDLVAAIHLLSMECMSLRSEVNSLKRHTHDVSRPEWRTWCRST